MRRILIPILMMLMLVGCGQPEPVKVSDQTVNAHTSPKTGVKNPGLIPIEDDEGSDTTPANAEQAVTQPQATTPEKKPVQADRPSEIGKPDQPVPTPTEPAPTGPTPTEPVIPNPPVEETQPPATEQPTEPTPTNPAPTEPKPTDPAPTEPAPTEPTPTEPEAEQIDIEALESYGRSYASSTYGYNGTSACTPGTGAGYFPAATKEILSMEDGYSYVRQAIDSQYNRDIAYGYLPYEEIDGKTVRCPINVSVDSAGGNTYTITVYYGGTA